MARAMRTFGNKIHSLNLNVSTNTRGVLDQSCQIQILPKASQTPAGKVILCGHCTPSITEDTKPFENCPQTCAQKQFLNRKTDLCGLVSTTSNSLP
ncbi:hypothetical protein ABKN59_006795 [Abortiporus biennis]